MQPIKYYVQSVTLAVLKIQMGLPASTYRDPVHSQFTIFMGRCNVS